MLYRLAGKTTLLFKNKACEFLNAYTTNVVEAPRNAFIDIRGRIVAVCDQKKIDAETVLIVIEGRFLGRLAAHLKNYLLLGDTQIEQTDYLAYFDLASDETAEGKFMIPQKKGRLILDRKEMASTVSDEAFTLFRLRNHIPVQGLDYDEEMILNLDDEGLVSFTKGCYLGQEIVARVHARGRPPRKLVVKAETECRPGEAARMTSKVFDKEIGAVRGFVFIDNAEYRV